MAGRNFEIVFKEKVIKKVLKIIGIAFAVIVALVVGLLLYIASQPAVPKNYTEKVKTGGNIEKKYLQMGQYEVSYMENNAMQSYKKYEIWYPSEITNSDKKCPVVVFANGTGVKASKYKALFEYLASWGFIISA